jgi:hypothetical protein
LYEPTDRITVCAYGKSFNLSGGQKEFGQELWDKLTLAIVEVSKKEEPNLTPALS